MTIERPLRLSAQITDSAIAALRFAPKPFNAVMQSIDAQLGTAFGTAWTAETYGQLQDVALEVRALIKAEFPELKEKTLKRYWTAKSGCSRKP